jgi:molecular chaperone GrpE
MKARKIPITGVARKLPIDEIDEGADITWSDDSQSSEDLTLLQFECNKLEEKIKHIERDRFNLENELHHIKPDLENKNKIINDLKDDYERLRNDFDKYKKRIRSEEREKTQYATMKLIEKLLDVLDNFDRTKKIDIITADKEDILKGVELIHNQILDILQLEGLKQIESKGEPFDPYFHEAISTEATDEHPNNTILDEFQKGYMFYDKVLRASKVRVTQSDNNPALPTKRELEQKRKKKEKAKEMEKEKTREKKRGKKAKKDKTGKKKRKEEKESKGKKKKSKKFE